MKEEIGSLRFGQNGSFVRDGGHWGLGDLAQSPERFKLD